MSVSAHDVAAELRRRFPDDPGILKVHKLLYYAQGWHLAWFGEPLFRERIQAWTKGPVVADLWHDENKGRPRPAAHRLDGHGLAVLDYVVGRYGDLTPVELIRRTHNEDPWRDASESDHPRSGANPEITHEALRVWFKADGEYRTRAAEVERMRDSSTYTFGRLAVTDALEDAVARALGGERVHPSQLT